jgi:hypothetical protein
LSRRGRLKLRQRNGGNYPATFPDDVSIKCWNFVLNSCHLSDSDLRRLTRILPVITDMILMIPTIQFENNFPIYRDTKYTNEHRIITLHNDTTPTDISSTLSTNNSSFFLHADIPIDQHTFLELAKQIFTIDSDPENHFMQRTRHRQGPNTSQEEPTPPYPTSSTDDR